MALADLSSMTVADYQLNPQRVSEKLALFCAGEPSHRSTLTRVKSYYSEGGAPVWLDAYGFDARADTLLRFLEQQLPLMGFSERPFHLSQIAADLQAMRTLRFPAKDDASSVAARLEYNLTRAYMLYVSGQRFGFINPGYVLNHFDARSRDTLGHATAYHHLFDVPIEHADNSYQQKALSKVSADSLGIYLRRVAPRSVLYARLQSMLPAGDTLLRRRIMVNMERCRWRESLSAADAERYVVVNVPAYHLWAVSPDTIVHMRVACGATRTKTPLLTSRITHMEVNPEWSVPMSIISADMARHAGDSSYFARHRYYIADRKTGRHLSPRHVSADMLRSGHYRVAQRGGAGNSLGRIIFRFPNNFSVFLHDTSSPGAFGRDDRGVSHGCVRVQCPFDLAQFLLGSAADEWQLDQLRISMGMKPATEQGQDYIDALPPDAPAPQLVRSLAVNPRVPVLITYYTIFLTPDGTLQHYPDVYGYDKAIGEALKPFIAQ